MVVPLAVVFIFGPFGQARFDMAQMAAGAGALISIKAALFNGAEIENCPAEEATVAQRVLENGWP
jgi:hypothetical protein